MSESKKNNKKAIHSQGLLKNVSALGVQNITSQLLIKPMQKYFHPNRMSLLNQVFGGNE